MVGFHIVTSTPIAATLGEVIHRAAARWPRRTLLLFGRLRLSYGAADRRVTTLAARLRALGARPGDRIAIHMENRPEYLLAYFGIPASGAVAVPLNSFLSPPELHAILSDCGARALICSAASLEKLAPALDSLPDLRDLLVVDDAAPGGLPAGQRCERLTLDSDAAPADDPAPPAQVDSSAPAVLIYTSGTTGKPKGVALSHQNLIANAEACIEAVGVSQRDRILVFLPMFHSFTEMVGMLTPVMAGMSIALCGKLDRAEVKRTIMRHRPTILPAVPSVYRAMAQARISPLARWLNPVRLYICGGSPLPLSTLRDFERTWRRPLCEGYGLSEAGPVVSLNPPQGPRKPGSVGRPLPGVAVSVAPVPGGALQQNDEPGELLVRSPAVMSGYWNLAEESRRTVRDGWLHTGDMARVDADGYIFIVGRSKEMLIYRGMNIYPREIEEVLAAVAGVKEAAVIGVPDASRGEVPCAFVELDAGARLSEGDLRHACQKALARYKVPRVIRVLEALPRNAAGKVLKTQLQTAAAQLSGSMLVG